MQQKSKLKIAFNTICTSQWSLKFLQSKRILEMQYNLETQTINFRWYQLHFQIITYRNY